MHFDEQPLTRYPRLDAEVRARMSVSDRVQAVAVILAVLGTALAAQWLGA